MKSYVLEQDLKLFYVIANRFPEGVAAAFELLQKKLPAKNGRVFFGISSPGHDGNIVYKAAVLEIEENEGKKYDCDTFTLKKGEYITETIMQWKESISMLSEVFGKMLRDPRIDPQGECVEWYKSDAELMCMVRLDPSKNHGHVDVIEKDAKF